MSIVQVRLSSLWCREVDGCRKGLSQSSNTHTPTINIKLWWPPWSNTSIIYCIISSSVSNPQNWHKRCFNCANCNRHLDSTTVNDGPDGEIYCRGCHRYKLSSDDIAPLWKLMLVDDEIEVNLMICFSGKFGLTGYGFGQGAGTLLSVSKIRLLMKCILPLNIKIFMLHDVMDGRPIQWE